MALERKASLLYMAREASAFVLAIRAEEYAHVWGKSLDHLEVPVRASRELDPRTTMVLDPSVSGFERIVWMPTLASRLALGLGLYETLDHAEQTPYRTAKRTAVYITERAVLRLAMSEGEEVTRFLRERHQFDRAALGELRYFRA